MVNHMMYIIFCFMHNRSIISCILCSYSRLWFDYFPDMRFCKTTNYICSNADNQTKEYACQHVCRIMDIQIQSRKCDQAGDGPKSHTCFSLLLNPAHIFFSSSSDILHQTSWFTNVGYFVKSLTESLLKFYFTFFNVNLESSIYQLLTLSKF